ncbi:unnamed protein product [Sphagnum balticum]
MAELDSVHRYAAGGLFALALSQAQIQQHSLPGFGFPPVLDPTDGHSSLLSLAGDGILPWSCEQSGLLRHIFRYLGIDEKAWVGLEYTSLSPDAMHHIEAFLRILSEDDAESSSRSTMDAELSLANAVDAMVRSVQDKQGYPDTNDSQTHPVGRVFQSNRQESWGFTATAKSLTTPRKVAVLYTLLAGCVADSPAEKAGKTAMKTGYDARQRSALRLLALWLDIDWSKMAAMELMVAYMAMAAQKEREQKHVDDEEVAQSRWSQWRRGGLIGAAALTGGAILAITGGLAAPAIAAGMAALGAAVPVLGATGLTAAAAVAGSAVGSVAVAASFGAAGAGLTGIKMARRTSGIDEFQFEVLGENHKQGRLAVEIVVSGLIFNPEDFKKPWEAPDADLERYALRWETENILAVSTAIKDWLTSTAASQLIKRGAMYTVLGGLMSALAWPATLLSATDFIDSKWAIAVDRSDKAGKLLAMILLKGGQGNRPVTLMGYSLGARVIFSCLEELSRKGDRGAIVERVVLLGAPITLDKGRWEMARKVVAGRFVNAFSSNDWILGVVYRATFLTQGLAGLQVVDIPGIENVDVSELVDGHSAYLTKLGEILQGIEIDSFYANHSSKLYRSPSFSGHS